MPLSELVLRSFRINKGFILAIAKNCRIRKGNGLRYPARVYSCAHEHVLLEFVSRIAGFKLPRRIEFSADPLPKTGTGKILKREIRENYWTGKPVRVGQA